MTLIKTEDSDIIVACELTEDYTVHIQSRKVYSVDGVSPTVLTNSGGTNMVKILEKDNIITESMDSTSQNAVTEPQTLTKRRTEEGRELRKQGIDVYANRELTPRTDGVSGTITTVLKDNYVIEPNNDTAMEDDARIKVAARLADERFGKEQNRKVYDVDGIAPTQDTCQGGNRETKIMENVPLDEYENFVVYPRSDGQLINGSYNRAWKSDKICGAINCTKTMEVFMKDEESETNPRIEARPHGYYKGGTFQEVAPCLKSSAYPENNPLYESSYRIRKLTPKECFRLMGLHDTDIEKIQRSGISNAQQYKLAGNSIVVDVLEGIFRKLLVEREPDKSVQLTLDL